MMDPPKLSVVYDHIACLYDVMRPVWVGHDTEKALRQLFAERVNASSRILELGSGTGTNLRYLMKGENGFASYLGLDSSRNMLNKARCRFENDPRVDWMIHDVTQPFELESTFDFIFSSWVLSHLENPLVVVSSVIEKLAPGGTAAFVFFSPPNSKFRARLTGWFMRSLQCSWIDPTRLASHACFERENSFHNGTSSLVTFRRPDLVAATSVAS